MLGCHRRGDQWLLRALLPGAAEVEAVSGDSRTAMQRVADTDLFTCTLAGAATVPGYQLRWRPAGGDGRAEDPYRFGPTVGDLDLHLFGEGKHRHIYRCWAHCCEHEGVAGVRFATWAPNAKRVSVVGDFNQWHGLRHAMRARGLSGVFGIFIPAWSPA